MPDFSVDDIEIEPHEYVNSCSKNEIEELLKELEDGGYINTSAISSEIRKDTINKDCQYVDALSHLRNKRHLLTLEQEEFIIELAKKYQHI